MAKTAAPRPYKEKIRKLDKFLQALINFFPILFAIFEDEEFRIDLCIIISLVPLDISFQSDDFNLGYNYFPLIFFRNFLLLLFSTDKLIFNLNFEGL